MPSTIDNGMSGAHGEALFDAYCAEAGLVSNPSSRDRTGWDRIVEFPLPPAEPVTIDKRPAPISCHVQIKTITAGARSCRLRLSSAERLAKDPKPAFVYVLAGVASGKPRAYLIHLSGPAIARILKRLRLEHQAGGGASRINRMTISLPIDLGVPLAATGEALRSAIEAAVGGPNALPAYIARKSDEFAKLGYDDHSHIGSITIKAGSMDELVDGFLGLKPLTTTSFSASERRFGVEIVCASHEGVEGRLNIAPTTPKACRMVCKRGASGPPAVLDGEIRFPALPGLPVEHIRLLFQHPLFHLTIPLSKERSFRLNGNEEAWKTAKVDAKVWLNMHRLMAYLAEGGTSMRLESEGLPPVEFMSSAAAGVPNCEHNRTCQLICSNLVRLQELLGIETLALGWDEVLASANDVADCLAFVDGQVEDGFVSFATEGGEITGTTCIEFIYLHTIPVGEIRVIVAARAKARGTPGDRLVQWSLNAPELIDLTWTDAQGAGAEAFQSRVAHRTGIINKICWTSPRMPLDKASLDATASPLQAAG